jgi:hypothetical protein
MSKNIINKSEIRDLLIDLGSELANYDYKWSKELRSRVDKALKTLKD